MAQTVIAGYIQDKDNDMEHGNNRFSFEVYRKFREERMCYTKVTRIENENV